MKKEQRKAKKVRMESLMDPEVHSDFYCKKLQGWTPERKPLDVCERHVGTCKGCPHAGWRIVKKVLGVVVEDVIR